MKVVGKRKESPIEFHASAEKFKEGALFNDGLQRLAGKNSGFFPRGVYHYATHEEANRHWEDALVKSIVDRALRSQKDK